MVLSLPPYGSWIALTAELSHFTVREVLQRYLLISNFCYQRLGIVLERSYFDAYGRRHTPY